MLVQDTPAGAGLPGVNACGVGRQVSRLPV